MSAEIKSHARLGGIEFVRFLAAVAVVLIHFWPRRPEIGSAMLGYLVIGTSRFAVPFFFATSAYFLKDRIPSLREGGRFARKWLTILVFWHFVHAVWFTILHIARDPDPFHTAPLWVERILSIDMLFEGVAWPLWYLHTLVICVVLASAIPGRFRVRILLPAGIVLYAFALSWDAWRGMMPSWWCYPPFHIKAREFLFTGLLPFAIGLATRRRPPLSVAIGVVSAGFAIQTSEILLSPLTSWGEQHEYFLGSVVAGAGLLWLGLGWDVPRPFAKLGAASLPMYILQLIVFAGLHAGFEVALRPLGLTAGFASMLSIAVSLPLFTAICVRISNQDIWIRFHR